MNKIVLIILSLFIISCDKKGEVIEQKYSDGQKRLVVKYGDNEEILSRIGYYSDGTLKFEENWKNGTFHGKNLSYYDDSQLKEEENYNHGKKDGYYKRYCPDGKIGERGRYENDKKEGDWVLWSCSTGNLWIENTYRDGELHGVETYYHPNGNIRSQYNYVYGEIDYNRNGQFCDYQMIDGSIYFGNLDWKGTYQNGEMWDGIDIGWWDKDQVYLVDLYSNGFKYKSITHNLDREFMSCTEHGTKYSTKFEYIKPQPNLVGGGNGYWCKDKREGKWTFYHSNGNKSYEQFYINGKLHGEDIKYDEYGNIIRINKYEYGQFLEEIVR